MDLDVTEGELDDIVTAELREKKYPTFVPPRLNRYGRTGECQCPNCRRQRRQAQRDASASKPRPKSKKPHPDSQMLLFDDLYDEEDALEETDILAADGDDEVSDLDTDDLGALTGIPTDVLEVLSEVSALNNGKPFTDANLDRVLEAYPDLRERLYSTLMENMMNGGLTLDMFDFDFPESLPFGPRPQSQKRKKRRR